MIDSPQGNGDRGRMIERPILESTSGSVTAFSTLGTLLGIIILCVFAAQTAQEYSLGTLRNLLVRQPRRWLLLAGKFGAMKLFALVFTILNAVVSIAISYFLSDRAKVSTDVWFTSEGINQIVHTVINSYIAIVFFGIFGMVLGIFLRSPISSISVGVLWLLIIENLIIAVKSETADWMPGNQLQTIASGGTSLISYSHALIVGGSYVFVVVIAAFTLFSQRDVAN
jgi:ABC-type transport system involved in multi-copper enzyme maturation permease subunit